MAKDSTIRAYSVVTQFYQCVGVVISENLPMKRRHAQAMQAQSDWEAHAFVSSTEYQ